jgi:hypothetical protein
MLAFSLLHQNSIYAEARSHALRLARALCEKRSRPLDPGFVINVCSHSSPFMFIQSSLTYSRALASLPQHRELIAPLLREAERLNAMVGEEDRRLLFQMLVPWIEQVGDTIQAKLAKLTPQRGSCRSPEARDTVFLPLRHVFRSLLHLTIMAHRSSVTAHIVNDLWMALLNTSNAHVLAKELVDFLIQE